MLSWRLYRAAFLPVLLALAVAAFSLTAMPAPRTSTLAPDAFDGAAAFAELQQMARAFPDRGPGSPADERLAGHVRRVLEGLGGTAGGGFQVRVHRFGADTAQGRRTLTTVIAQRPGSSSESPIVIVAHRDAPSDGQDAAELSGTAALLELARVFSARETKRTIVLVSTSAGSGGDAGVADFAAHRGQLGLSGPVDAAIALGDVAGTSDRKPIVIPYSDGLGAAPAQLQRTVENAIAAQTGTDPGAPSLAGQLAHLAFNFTVGEQGPLDAAGIPAVLVQASGEAGPSAREGVSAERMEGLGRSVLLAVDAVDGAPDMPSAMQAGVLVQHQLIPAWALRLLIAALLLPPLVTALDGLARARRRGQRGQRERRSLGRPLLWTLSCALPLLACAVCARLLGLTGAIGAPPQPVEPAALTLSGAAVRSLAVVVLLLALTWLLRRVLLRRAGLQVTGEGDLEGLTALMLLLGVAVIVWLANPYAALLLIVALHALLPIVSDEPRPRPLGALALVGLSLVPLALLMLFYAHELRLAPGQLAWSTVLLLAGGHVGPLAMLLWSLGLGCTAAIAVIACRANAAGNGAGTAEEPLEITIRGPLSYAGPGSLGGTESALRR